MTESIFTNGNPKDQRDIRIIIDHDFIRFYYNKHYEERLKYIEDETEVRLLSGIEEMTEDEMCNDEFYGFDKDRWHHPKENFPEHMMRKWLFTEEMLGFINKNVSK